MTPEQVAAAKDRMESATPGPWYAAYVEWSEPEDERVGNWYVCNVEGGEPFEGRGAESFVADFVHEKDAQFIAAAPEDLRLVLAEIERLQAEVLRLEAFELDFMRERGVWTHSTPEETAEWMARYSELECRLSRES